MHATVVAHRRALFRCNILHSLHECVRSRFVFVCRLGARAVERCTCFGKWKQNRKQHSHTHTHALAAQEILAEEIEKNLQLIAHTHTHIYKRCAHTRYDRIFITRNLARTGALRRLCCCVRGPAIWFRLHIPILRTSKQNTNYSA